MDDDIFGETEAVCNENLTSENGKLMEKPWSTTDDEIGDKP